SADPWHALSCPCELAGTRTELHDEIKYGVAKWATRLGARVEVEPRADGRHPQRQPRKRGRRRGRDPPPPPAAAVPRAGAEGKQELKAVEPGKNRFDLRIWGFGEPVYVDFVIKHSPAPSHIDDCAEDAVVEAEAEKARKYRDLAENMGAKFFAFARPR